MNKDLALPAAIALSAHALIFALSGSPAAPVKAPKFTPVETKPFELKLVPDEEPPLASDTDNHRERGGPALPDLPDASLATRVDTTVFTTVFHPTVPRMDTGALSIPSDGNLGGDEVVRRATGSISVDLLDHTPVYRMRASPVYPYEMKHAGISGEVLVEFTVDTSGNVRDARVVRSTRPEFEAATLRAIEKWRFEPGTRNNRPVSFRMSVPVVFNLSGTL